MDPKANLYMMICYWRLPGVGTYCNCTIVTICAGSRDQTIRSIADGRTVCVGLARPQVAARRSSGSPLHREEPWTSEDDAVGPSSHMRCGHFALVGSCLGRTRSRNRPGNHLAAGCNLTTGRNRRLGTLPRVLRAASGVLRVAALTVRDS
jgi:hypothetical protein